MNDSILAQRLLTLSQVLQLVHMLTEGAYKANQLVFKNTELQNDLLAQFQYSFERFALVFVSRNLNSANASDKAHQDVAYLFWRILDAHEAFYAQFKNAIATTHPMIIDALTDIPNHIKPVKEHLASMITDFSAYADMPNSTAAINRYLVSAESEINMGGYGNEQLANFLPLMPKYQKYALILGQPPIAIPGATEEMYNQIFAPNVAGKTTGSITTKDQPFLKVFHQTLNNSLFASEQKSSSSTQQPSSSTEAASIMDVSDDKNSSFSM